MFKGVISIAFFLIKDDPNIPPLAEDIVLSQTYLWFQAPCGKEETKRERKGEGIGEGGRVSESSKLAETSSTSASRIEPLLVWREMALNQMINQ